MHFYAACVDKESSLNDVIRKFRSRGLSYAEYRLDALGHVMNTEAYSDYTYSIFGYGITGRTDGLASLFEEGPSILVEPEEEEKKKKKKKKREMKEMDADEEKKKNQKRKGQFPQRAD